MVRTPKPIVLLILDGWGHSDNKSHNPLSSVPTPTVDHLTANYPHTLLAASGTAVGLPVGQMGNSEVGHLHIGAGRKVPQDLTRINQAIADRSFEQNPVLLNAINACKKTGNAIHILGLLSPGGVHSQDTHIAALIALIQQHGIKKHYLHAILDGRDTPPKSALASIDKITALYQQGTGHIASLIGRYYAMDRDKRWERTEQAYDLYTQGTAHHHAHDAAQGLATAYAAGETDEFVKATAIHNDDQNPVTIADGDVVIFMNFRADRARQLSHALTDQDFNGFKRKHVPNISQFLTLTQYAKDINAKVIYTPLTLNDTLGEYLSKQSLHQLRLAETEKYAHVTYFLNGGREKPFANEDRLLIPSPKVATYDLQPEMSAITLTDRLIDAIEGHQYDVIICNYANPDMVGHTGIETAANQAVSVIDHCLQRIVASTQHAGGELLITADHGNIECMYDPQTQQPHTAHTNNLVPLIYMGRPAKFEQSEGALDDIAPTLLYLLGLKPPAAMTGHNLLKIT